MQRVSSARSYLRSTVPGTIRKKSTQSPPKTQEAAAPKKSAKLTTKRWDDIILPSREEVIAQRQAAAEKAQAKPAVALSESKTDIGYLKFESNASLAARLARPIIDIQERMLREKEERAAAESVKPDEQQEAQSDHAKPFKISLTPAEQRRAVRLAREAAIEKLAKIRAAKEERRRTKAEQVAISETEQQLQNLDIIAQSLKSGNSPHVAPPSAALSDRIKESAAKRRAERIAREAEGSQLGADGDRVQQRHRREVSRPRQSSGKRGVNHRARKQPEEDEDTFEEELVNEDGIPGYLPELTGPPIHRLELTPIRQPTLVSPYTRYIPESLSFTTKRADHLYAPTQLVQMVLSHRMDVSVPKRKHALDIVEKFTKSSSLSKVTA